jgi:hypothetical protein
MFLTIDRAGQFSVIWCQFPFGAAIRPDQPGSNPGRLTPASSLIRQNPPSLRTFILCAQIGTEKAYLISQESRDRRRGG